MSMSRLDRIRPTSSTAKSSAATGTAFSTAATANPKTHHQRRPIGHAPKKLSMSMSHLSHGTSSKSARSTNPLLHAAAAGSPAAAFGAAAVGRPPRQRGPPPVSQSARAKFNIRPDEGLSFQTQPLAF